MKLLNGGDSDEPPAATQTGGLIGNVVACSILLYMSIRAEWMFNKTGGLRGDGLSKEEQMAEMLLIKQEQLDAENGGKGTAEENDLPTEAGETPKTKDKKEKKETKK